MQDYQILIDKKFNLYCFGYEKKYFQNIILFKA